MRISLTRWSSTLIPLSVLLLTIALRAVNPPFLEDAQLRVFDSFQRMRPRTYEPVPVRVVDLDDATLDRLGQWPWPRTQVAELIRRLHELGAASIALDIVFAEPDRTSPARILPLWPSSPELDALRATESSLPDHDRLLAETIREARVVTGFALTNDTNAKRPIRKAGMAHAGDDPSDYAVYLSGAVTSLEQLEAAASGNGHFNLLGERDGIIRRVPLLLRLGDTLYPSLVMEAVRVAQGASAYKIKSSGASGEASFGQHTGIIELKIGQFVVPTDGRGRVWVYYAKESPERTIPAWRVLEGELPPDALEGQIVLIGTSATGLRDLRATPLNPVAAGIHVHASIAEQILTQSFLSRPDWARGAELVYLLILGVALIVLLPRVGALWCAVAGGLSVIGISALSWYSFVAHRLLLDPVFPSLVALLIYLVSSLLSFLRTEAERRQVRDAFGHYLSPDMVERLAKHPEQLTLGGESRTMTLLFADIRDFATIAERFDAKGLTQFMNWFLTPMTRVIMNHGGTIDKYMGDCIMAFWNAPLDDPKHATHACEGALAMRNYMVTWNKGRYAEAQRVGIAFMPVNVGIGLNTGDCCVGNVGSDQRFDYSALGDTVNLASRLEGQSKVYGVDIVLGEGTAEQVRGEHAVLELDLIRVKGKTKPSRIFALLGDPSFKASPEFQALEARHRELLAAYQARRWEDAHAKVQECLALDTKRTRLRILYALYTERVEAFINNPPDEGWDGVFEATSK